jgi:hypothetical protein
VALGHARPSDARLAEAEADAETERHRRASSAHRSR